MLLPDIEDVLPGEYLASAHRIEVHAELFALGEDAIDELGRKPFLLFVFAGVAAGAFEVAAHRRADHDELGRLEPFFFENLLPAVDPGEKRVDEKVADELLATPRGNPRDDVLDENRGGVALLEELVQICRTLFVLGIVREFFAEGDHANDVLGR